jgi:hypothetical protein
MLVCALHDQGGKRSGGRSCEVIEDARIAQAWEAQILHIALVCARKEILKL